MHNRAREMMLRAVVGHFSVELKEINVMETCDVLVIVRSRDRGVRSENRSPFRHVECLALWQALDHVLGADEEAEMHRLELDRLQARCPYISHRHTFLIW